MSATCNCGRPMPGTSSVCGACVADLERALGDVAFLAAQLKVSFTRQSRMGSGDGGRRSAERPLPFDLRASRVAAELRNTLVGWVRVLQEQVPAPLSGPVCAPACRHGSCRKVRATREPSNTMPAMAAWILLHLDGVRRHEAGAEMVEEITTVVLVAEKAIDRPAELVYSGPCDECGTDLYGRMDAAQVTCRECGYWYDIAARRAWLLAEAEDQLAHAALVARALNRLGTTVKVDRIYKWVERSQLVAHGVDAQGRPTYRIGDVLELIAKMPVKTERISA